MKIVNIHRKKTPNLGDLASAPAKYFIKSKNGIFIDILDCETPDARISGLLESADFLIIGGGGLLANPKFSLALENIIYNYAAKCIIWGAGANSVGEKFIENDLSKIKYIGIRDSNTNYQWVPCASCLHSDIIEAKKNRNSIYKGGVGIVENDSGQSTAFVSDFDIPNIRRLGNKKIQAKDMFEFISGSDLIITSSFHAAYWATLLEIPVIGIPTSIKFHTLRHTIPLASKGNWIAQLGYTKTYPEALSECIEANKNFLKCLPFEVREELAHEY